MVSKLNLQEVFLNQMRHDKMSINMFLTNGFKLKGIVTGFDNFCVIIECEGKQYLIYKHAISTIIPASNVDFAAAFVSGKEE